MEQLLLYCIFNLPVSLPYFIFSRTNSLRRFWRDQWGNQNPLIEGQTTQWPKEKGQKETQRSTKHTHKSKERLTRTPLKTVGELACSGRVSSSCITSGTPRINIPYIMGTSSRTRTEYPSLVKFLSLNR
jgi:hypothetical protein